MAKLKVIEYPNPILRKKASKIKDFGSAELGKLISEMVEILKSAEGLGLAAPQVGKSRRVCVAREENNNFMVLINPVITASSRKKIPISEGCLSFPGKFYSISRPESIKVRHIDEKGKKCKIKASGLLARVIQHEVDHLDGILFIDRVKNKAN
jgi:peptide deformylase